MLENYKKNNLYKNWEIINNPWVYELYKMPFISFLRKINGKRLFNKYMELRYKITKKPIISLLEYIITTRCTMNCKECNTKIPEYNKNNTHSKIISFEDFKKDIDKLLLSVDYIEFLGLVGGEPLLAKDLYKILEYAAQQPKIHHIFVASNATILPDKNLLLAMKNKKISVQVSDYRNVKNLNSGVTVKYDEYKKMLLENKIQFNNYQEKRNATTWFSMPKIYKDTKSPEENKRQFNSRFASYVHMLCEGVIYNCMLSTYIDRNLETTLEIKKELINIRKTQTSKELTTKLIQFYSKPYSECCNYCHFDDIKYDLPCGEQV